MLICSLIKLVLFSFGCCGGHGIQPKRIGINDQRQTASPKLVIFRDCTYIMNERFRYWLVGSYSALVRMTLVVSPPINPALHPYPP